MVDFAPVRYLDFLAGLHERLEPPTYLEIGVRGGDSLALSRARSVGIDPAFAIKRELDCPLTLVRATSDDYFARPALAPFDGRPAALAFIDGMHLFEYALRDFVNVEAHADWWSVIVFDDILPRDVDEAARDRHTTAWTGDVYKIALVLRRHRPDLVCLPIGTRPTGLLAVVGADPASAVLRDRYDALVAEHVVDDPQPVPVDVFRRRGVLDPETALDAPLWSLLRDARERGTPRAEGMAAVRRCVDETLKPRLGERVRGGAKALLRRRAG